MASFYNLDVEQAFEKIRSGISGETEPLKQLGINMSVANLEAFALANGIGTAYDKMSQAEQATLRYNYLMAQTADAQGDFAKTSDSFANQQRILQLQINDLSASLGEKLLPYLNDVLITINDDLPELSEKADELFSKIGDGIDWIMDNGDLVIGIIEGLAVSFGTLTAAAKLGNLIDGIKKFKDVAAGAGAALNPLLIAFAALTAAALAAKGAIDNYTGSMDVSHIDDQTKVIMDETEAIKEQKREYDELIEKKNENIESDLAEANNIKRLWIELQNYTDESGKVYKERERANEIISLLNENYGLNIGYIDDQIQGYQELASSMDDYIEKLRIESRIRNGQEAYDEAVKNYDELIKKRDELQDSLKSYEQNVANYEELYRSGNYDESNKDDIFDQLGDAYAQRSAVQEQIDNINELISTEQKEMEEYESLFEEKNKLADTSAVGGGSGTGSGVDSDKTDLEKYEEKLQTEEDLLEHSLKTRNITAEQYDQQLMEKLNSDLGFDNAEELKKDSELYYQLLEKHEDYIEDKKTADEKAAEDAREAAEKAAEEQQKIADEANKEAQKELENSLKEQQKTIDKELDKIIKKYDEQYKQLENLQSDYKKKLMSIGGDLFSVEEIENEDGSKTKKYIVNDLDKQLAAMQKYHSQIKKLKDQGASNELLSELFSLGDEDGKIFADKLSNMSEQEFSKINELYSEKQKLADELSEDLYKSDAEKISAAVENELENLANKGDVLGKEAAEIYAEAFKNELAEQFDKLEEIFGDTEFTSNLKAMVESEAAASVPAAAYGGTVINNNVTNQSAGDTSYSRIFDEFFDKLNKPIQITLDGKIIGESVLNYSGNKKRSTGT